MSREEDREKLAALVAATARKAEVKALLAETKAQWETARAQAILAEERLKTETADVERLDRKSLPNLFLSVTGRMGDRREAERAEADEAQALFDTAAARAEALHGQVTALEAEMRSLGNCDRDLDALATTLTAAIPAEGGDLAAEIGELKAKEERNTAEATELGELLEIGERLNRVVGSMLPILWNAAEKERQRREDGPLPPYRHGHTFKSEVNTILDEAETYLPMLVSLAESFTTTIMDIPPLGSLHTVKSTFDGTYTASTLTQIEGTAKELEALTAKVDRSMERIRRVKEKREETALTVRADRIQKLIG